MALEKIVAHKRRLVAARKAHTPLTEIGAGLAPSDRDFRAALAAPRTGFILECKRASPSAGRICEDYDPAKSATRYAAVADAISVLTDERFFEGSLAHLRAVREAVSLPVLCKDVVVDPYQVHEARLHGADAVLLMLSVLDDETYGACREAARRLGMTALTEVHDADELARAGDLGADPVGINNRNLRTLEVDLGVTERLAGGLRPGVVAIAESGVGGHRDVLRLRHLVDGFLIGSRLMRSTSPAHAARAVVHGRVKVCGLTRPADASAVWHAGATHGGLIFAPESPRRVSSAEATAVQSGAPLCWIGVFVNAPAGEVARLAGRHTLAAVQLHGEESPRYVHTLRGQLPTGCEIWKAARIRDAVPPVSETAADRLVLDTHRPGRRGGTGERFDWSLLDDHPQRDRMILGGGLTPQVAASADSLGAWALDVCSGLESAPGIKDHNELRRFFGALRGAGRRVNR